MGHGATTATLLAVLLLSGCSSSTDPQVPDGAVITDPLSQTTQTWTVDRPTDDWFSTLCGVLVDLEPSFDDPDQVVADLTTSGDRLLLTSSQLGGKPVPSFEGGSAYAAEAVSDLAELGRAFHVAAEQWDDGQDDLARQTVQQAVTDRSPDLTSLDPNISTPLRNLPACQSVRSTF